MPRDDNSDEEFDRKHLGRKRGAPIGNQNAIRHGLSAGKLPRGAAYVTRIIGQLRSTLESAVADAKGEISFFDAAVIQTAVRWERHSLLAQRWLRKDFECLNMDQRLYFSREVARASGERDKCLKMLGLDRQPSRDVWDSIEGIWDRVEAPDGEADN